MRGPIPQSEMAFDTVASKVMVEPPKQASRADGSSPTIVARSGGRLPQSDDGPADAGSDALAAAVGGTLAGAGVAWSAAALAVVLIEGVGLEPALLHPMRTTPRSNPANARRSG